MNIANMSLNRDRRGGAALTVVETDQKIPRMPWSVSRRSTASWAPPTTRRRKTEMALDSMQEIFDKIQAGRKPFWAGGAGYGRGGAAGDGGGLL